MGTLTTANLGACRAVICNSTTGEELSRDHVAADVEEAKRVEAAASVTGFQGRTGDDGMLYATVGGREYSCPITRSIGNVQLKNIGLIACRPEVSTRELTRNDKFLIIASPGPTLPFFALVYVSVGLRVCDFFFGLHSSARKKTFRKQVYGK
jgi:serine/threonine protein phosphatase PrpC